MIGKEAAVLVASSGAAASTAEEYAAQHGGSGSAANGTNGMSDCNTRTGSDLAAGLRLLRLDSVKDTDQQPVPDAGDSGATAAGVSSAQQQLDAMHAAALARLQARTEQLTSNFQQLGTRLSALGTDAAGLKLGEGERKEVTREQSSCGAQGGKTRARRLTAHLEQVRTRFLLIKSNKSKSKSET